MDRPQWICLIAAGEPVTPLTPLSPAAGTVAGWLAMRAVWSKPQPEGDPAVTTPPAADGSVEDGGDVAPVELGRLAGPRQVSLGGGGSRGEALPNSPARRSLRLWGPNAGRLLGKSTRREEKGSRVKAGGLTE